MNGTSLHVEDTGGPGPVVVFSHGLLWSGRMFDPQVAALRDHYRCITWDHRGQGRSADSKDRVVPIEQTYEDAVALFDKLGLPAVHFVGLSMGGFIGIRLAARHPERVRSLCLMASAADAEPKENHLKYRLLCLVVGTFGPGLVAGRVMPLMFGKSFLTNPTKVAERKQWRALLVGNRKSIVAAVHGVIERQGCEEALPKIVAPTLLLSGAEDVAIVPARMDRLRALLPKSELIRIAYAGHSMSVENPEAVNAALRTFLDRVSA